MALVLNDPGIVNMPLNKEEEEEEEEELLLSASLWWSKHFPFIFTPFLSPFLFWIVLLRHSVNNLGEKGLILCLGANDKNLAFISSPHQEQIELFIQFRRKTLNLNQPSIDGEVE